MKRNKQTIRAARKSRTQSGKSRYADKQRRGEQMYGPGCCAHGITSEQMAATRRRARESGLAQTGVYFQTSVDFQDGADKDRE